MLISMAHLAIILSVKWNKVVIRPLFSTPQGAQGSEQQILTLVGINFQEQSAAFKEPLVAIISKREVERRSWRPLIYCHQSYRYTLRVCSES